MVGTDGDGVNDIETISIGACSHTIGIDIDMVFALTTVGHEHQHWMFVRIG